MSAEYKEIMRHINRAKSQVSKMNAIKAMGCVVTCLDEMASVQLMGREKMEVEILLGEVLRGLSDHPDVRHMFPKGLVYQKGKEKHLRAQLTAVLNEINRAIEQAELNKMRAKVNKIDQTILTGQKLLDENNPLDARKVFRRVQEDYGTEPGVMHDMGARLLKAGLAPESIEYFEEAIKLDARDSRPYVHMVMAYEAIGELDKAEHMLKETLKNFGNNDRVYIRLAKVYLQKRKWSEAYDAAQSALGVNEFNRDAKKIIKQVEPRIFTNRGANPGGPQASF